MSQMTRWINRQTEEVSPTVIKKLAEEYNITETFATILHNRNLTSEKDFIMPTKEILNSPFLFEDMEKAVNRIMIAINKNEKITIYGDYDVDGVSGTTLLMLFFKKIGYNNVSFFIPDRLDGYGMNEEAIKNICNDGTTLIISVDCGITSIDEVELAKTMGVDVIITDHHEQSERLPDAIAVINPKKNGTTYPFKGLCGTAVAHKLAVAISTYFTNIPFSENLSEYYDIVTFATIADLVPLLEENRYMVKEGLKIFNSEDLRLAYKELIKGSRVAEQKIKADSIAFYLAPAINALGRVNNVTKAIEMFLSDDAELVKETCAFCHSCNEDRKQVEKRMTAKIFEKLPEPEDYAKYTLLDYDSSYHTGVKGIVASKVLQKYARPTIIFNENGDELEGSCRSIVGFNMKEALDYCADLTIKYGGHEMAAGVTIAKNEFNAFSERLEEYAKSVLTPELLKLPVFYDVPVKANDITFQLVDDFDLFEPYGQDNASPNLLLENAVVLSFNRVGKDNNTLKLKVQQNGFSIECIAFNMGYRAEELAIGSSINIIFKPEINNYRGKMIQLSVIDFNINDVADKDPTEVIYERAICPGPIVKIGDELKMGKVKDQILLTNSDGQRICLLSEQLSAKLLEGLSKRIFYKIEVNTITKFKGVYEISLKISPLHQ